MSLGRSKVDFQTRGKETESDTREMSKSRSSHRSDTEKQIWDAWTSSDVISLERP